MINKRENYSEVLNGMLVFCGQRNYELADFLGYDDSYISKWLNGTRLPASKNIRNINKEIAEFFLSDLSKSEILKIIQVYSLDFDINDKNMKNLIQDFIEEKLGEAYLESLNKIKNKNRKKQSDKQIEKNTVDVMSINPNNKRNELDKLIYERNSSIEGYIASNFYSINKTDKMYISCLNKNISKNMNIKHKITFLINFNDVDDNELMFNTVLFINMATLQNKENFDFEFLSYDFPSRTALAVIKDVCIHHALYTESRECLMTNTSIDEDSIASAYNFLEDASKNKAIPVFEKRSVIDATMSGDFTDILLNKELRVLAGIMNELLLPEDVFMQVSKEAFKDKIEHEAISALYSRIENLYNKCDVHLALFDTMIKKFIFTGEIRFFNKKVVLNTEDRMKCISHMNNIINKNINTIYIKEKISTDLNFFENPSLYILGDDAFMLEKYSDKFLHVQDCKLKQSLIRFFEQLYNMNKENIIKNKDFILEEIMKRKNSLVKAGN